MKLISGKSFSPTVFTKMEKSMRRKPRKTTLKWTWNAPDPMKIILISPPSLFVRSHFLHDDLAIVSTDRHTHLLTWPNSNINAMKEKGVVVSTLRTKPLSVPKDCSRAWRKSPGTSEIWKKVLNRTLWSVLLWGRHFSPFLGDCHLLASLSHSLFACASLFIANRALNLTLGMDIALCVSACAKEAINNVSYENLIISVFSPLAISLYLCPLSGRIWSQYSQDEVWMRSNTRGYKTVSHFFMLENISSLYYFLKYLFTISNLRE